MIEYPSPYKYLVWDYKHSDQDAVVKANKLVTLMTKIHHK